MTTIRAFSFLARTAVLSLALNLCFVPSVRAAITVVDYWRMGENDPNSTLNGVEFATPTTDIVGPRPMNLPGGPEWKSPAPVATAKTGSTLSLEFFTAGVWGTNGVIPSLTDNFGLEFWVEAIGSAGCVAYNGSPTNNNGWGIYVTNGLYQARIGSTYFGSSSAPASTTTWYHLALVRNNGTATFYINGVASGTSTVTPAAPTGEFAVAASPSDNTLDRFPCYLDEVRVFTFTAGQFSTSDLLVNAGPPTATTSAATSVASSTTTLNGSVNPVGLVNSYYFQYGLTTNYGGTTTTGNVPVTTSSTSVNAALTGLSATTLYHYRVVANNTAGTTSGSDLTFTTTASLPSATTLSASGVAGSSATLNGSVNPNGANTVYYFQYGPTAAYGSQSPNQPLLAKNGLTFNGVNQSAALSGNIHGLATGNTAHTIEAWINPTLLPASREWVVLLGNAGNGAHHWLLNADGSTQIGLYGGGQATPRLTSNVWTHVASCFDGTTLSVYTNGVLVGTTNVTFNLAGIPLTIAQAQGAESYYGGGITDFRIWNTGRTATQIQTNMNLSLAGTEAGLMAYYRMNEGSGTVLTDSSLHTNNLTTANGPTWYSITQSFTSVSLTTNGLAPGTLYHYRIVANNTYGTTSGSDLTFTTPAAAPTVTPQSASSITPTGATLNAQVNPNGAAATVYFKYGLSTSYGSFSPTNTLVATNINLSTNDAISGLTPATQYHYQVIASNSVGTISSSDQTFTTTGSVPTVNTQAASSITSSSAVLNTQVNPNSLAATVYFRYGLTTGYGSFSATNSLIATNILLSTNDTISGLQAGTLYHYQVVASNSVGTASGSDQTLTTLGVPPTVNTQAASAITGTSALLNVQINPNGAATAFYFRYGLTTNYGSFSATNSLTATNILLSTNAALSALSPATVYHYRVVASNSLGATTGPDQTLTTLSTAPTAVTQPATGISLTGATLNGLVTPNGATTTAFFRYGTNISYGSVTPALSAVNGLTFDGISVSAVTNSLAGLPTGNQPHTIEAWINPTLLPPSREWVILLGNFQGGAHHWLLNSDGTTQIGSLGGNQVNPTLTASVWTHLASVFDGTNLVVYTNGVPVGTNDASFDLEGIALSVGQAQVGESYYGGGMIELRVWNTNRSQAQIQAKMNSALTGTEANLVACYPMQEGSGGSLTDLSTNHNNLPLSGSPVWNAVFPPNYVPNISGQKAFAQSITNLIPGTIYHFQIVGSNSLGVASGSDLTFTNLISAPVVDVQPISNVTLTSATFNAAVNPEGLPTACYYQYGVTTGYGSYTATNSLSAGLSEVPVAVAAINLTPAASYHYRLVAVNNGGTTVGPDQTFVAGFIPTITMLPASGLNSTNATLNATVNPNGLPTSARFEWGAYMNFDHKINFSPVNSNAPVTLSAQLTNLTFGVPYHFRLFASNSVGIALGQQTPFYTFTLQLNGSATITNQYGATFIDPGATTFAMPAAVSGGDLAGYALRADGSIAGWGGYNQAQGDLNIPGGGGFAFVHGVRASPGAVAVRTDGSVSGWGNYPPYTYYNPGDLYNNIAFAEDFNNAFTLRPNGTVEAWGDNTYGVDNIPASVTNVIAIAGDRWNGAAVRADGTVVVWGDNANNQTNVPANVTNVVAITDIGYGGFLVLKADGSLVSWSAPAPPADATNIVSISSGGNFLALRGDGKLFAWGNDNSYGELNIPAAATNIVACSAGEFFNLAIRADGVGFGWGDNQRGATGVPALTNLSLPYSVNGTVNPAVPGSYPLTYAATNSCGYVATATRTVVVPPPAVPVAITLPATAVTNGSATLQGNVSFGLIPPAAWFQYGLTTAYGNTTAPQSVVIPNSGAIFDGSSQGVVISPLNGLDSGNTPHTIEAWLKPSLLPSGREWVILLGNLAGGAHHWLLNSDGSTQIGSLAGAQQNPHLNANVWTHLASTFDGTNLSVYANGVLVGSSPASFDLEGIQLSVAQAQSGESFYGGGMDQLTIWNTARTADQIQTDMAVGNNGTEPGLVACYRMNEGSGSTLNDATANNNTLSVNGGLSWGTDSPFTLGLITQNITGLLTNGYYHYRIVATNYGGITYGNDLTFTLGNPVVPFSLGSLTLTNAGNFQFTFTNTPGASFTVLTSTNLTNWIPLTSPVENPPGQYQVTIPTTNRARFFRVQSP